AEAGGSNPAAIGQGQRADIRIDFGVILRRRVPAYRAGGNRIGGIVEIGRNIDIGWNQFDSGSEGVGEFPGIFPAIPASRRAGGVAIVLSPGDGAEREVPALASPA